MISNKIQRRKDRNQTASPGDDSEQFCLKCLYAKKGRQSARRKKPSIKLLQLLSDKGYDALLFRIIIDPRCWTFYFYCHYESKELPFRLSSVFTSFIISLKGRTLYYRGLPRAYLLHSEKPGPYHQSRTKNDYFLANYTNSRTPRLSPWWRVTTRRPTQTFQPPTSGILFVTNFIETLTWW